MPKKTRRAPVCHRLALCRECGCRPQRAADEYCGQTCATAYERRHGAELGREAVEYDDRREGKLWDGSRRVNLQNSA